MAAAEARTGDLTAQIEYYDSVLLNYEEGSDDWNTNNEVKEALQTELDDLNREIANAKGDLARAASAAKEAAEKKAETERIA